MTYIGGDVSWSVDRPVGLQNILKNSKKRFGDYYWGYDLFLC